MASEHTTADAHPSLMHRWLLAAMTCLLIARPFLPGVSQAHYGQGALYVVLWLILLIVWLFDFLRDERKTFRFTIFDGAVLLLFAWQVVSGVVAVYQASPRPALNALWQWIAMAVSYGLARQLISTPLAARALCAVFAALAVAMAAIGLEQQWFSIPAAQHEYDGAKDDVRSLYVLTGEWLPPGSPERQRYESRLDSSEPTANFALTNSLAGFLAPWWIVLLGMGIACIAVRRPEQGSHSSDSSGICRKRTVRTASKTPVSDRQKLQQEAKHPRHFGRTIIWLVCLGIMGGCLILTKSRSALLAIVVGLILLWPLCFVGKRLRRSVGFVGIAATLLFAIAGIGFATGWLDRQLLAEAERSLGFRLQYWQSTWTMISDHPLFGCGPGQFQEAYTAYKLPDASEEIADPHNFLMEIGATAGLPALLAMVAVLAWLGRLASTRCAEDPLRLQVELLDQAELDDARWIGAGAAAGLFVGPILAWIDHLPVMTVHCVITAIVVPIAVWAFHGWVIRGHLPRQLPLIGIAVLLIHLLAAGGIGNPAVAGTFWVLVAVAMLPGVPRLKARGARHEKDCGASADRFPQSAFRCFEKERSEAHGEQLSNASVVLGRVSPRIRRIAVLTAMAVSIVALIAAYQTTYLPVLRCREYLAQADNSALHSHFPLVLQEVEAAVVADPRSASAARRLADFRLDALQRCKKKSAQALDAWIEADAQAISQAPNASRQWFVSSAGWQSVWKITGDPSHLDQAIETALEAIQFYPNYAQLHAHLARLFDQAKDAQAAQSAAREALRLDDTMRQAGHRDRFLAAEIRSEMGRLADLAPRSTNMKGSELTEPSVSP